MAKICDYKGLKLGKVEPEEVKEEEVQAQVEQMLKENVSTVPYEGEAKIGNIVNIDFEGFVDGVAFEGGKGEQYDLELGSQTFIPGFEDQLVGCKKDDLVDVNVTFPENYQAENLKGKPAVFKCKVNEVKQKVEPELNNEFAKQFNLENVEQLLIAVKNQIAAQRRHEVFNAYIQKICDYLAENSEIELSSEEKDGRIQEMLRYYEQSIAQYGATLESYLQMSGMDLEAFKEKLLPDAEKSLKIDKAYEMIAELESLEVSDEEFDRELAALQKYYQLSDEQLAKFKQERSNALRNEIKRQKVSQFLIDNND